MLADVCMTHNKQKMCYYNQKLHSSLNPKLRSRWKRWEQRQQPVGEAVLFKRCAASPVLLFFSPICVRLWLASRATVYLMYRVQGREEEGLAAWLEVALSLPCGQGWLEKRKNLLIIVYCKCNVPKQRWIFLFEYEHKKCILSVLLTCFVLWGHSALQSQRQTTICKLNGEVGLNNSSSTSL